ncbi:uncharacterized protein LOC132381975 [Hypanus sabinus]|uniref:uncharacterized protein LOC132381975 n=1 Tax=Hypanus sabinus TaxID=79690 RepID=UPI0028C485FF|nr:uncharacterized protein LOC132381975 [Hypanus sabinus]XP_059807674.1 uncharacterized protein LOC132381975 [Hypanus sabinus]XP_059807675.1 uncharacterized protein LOC132381975 [Hypanus sabinus]XP_059807676.1 uncharacterized protein LOC132381975 [Hypanus sabinus]XP_059807678.1 uncharacterized protein LOC132381975 [Hypanus sabinus]XP_059807679.1 uncharacterized protein LOC132381975 [Hypanus sabinus]XP_059807680.1 uncharacterized protein LOC132381975 [Hypanus sabinus]
MKFEPAKSRCLVIKKGPITQKFTLKIQDEEISSIIGNPIRCLGKLYDDSLKDVNNSRCLEQQTTERLVKIDKSGLPGRFKAWIFRHELLPRLMWPVMLYDIALSMIEGLERRINRYLRRWLGVQQCFSSTVLYSKSAKLQLPLSLVVEKFKVGNACLIITLKDSKGDKVSEAGVKIQTGRKWKYDVVAISETYLQEGCDWQLHILGFCCLRCDRIGGARGGAVALLARENITAMLWQDRLGGSSKETIWVELRNRKGVISLIGVYYRPPNGERELEEQICKEIADICIKHKVVIMGDFNFPHIDWEAHL